jgi:hypothetical protein
MSDGQDRAESRLVTFSRDVAWSKIQKGADAIVAKDGGLSRDQAVARFLNTPRGAAAYDAYVSGQAAALGAIEKSRNDAAERDLRGWVAKSAGGPGLSEAEEVFLADLSRPGRVEKSADYGPLFEVEVDF